MRSLLCLGACLLVVLAVVIDARPALRKKRSSGVLKAAKRCLNEDFKMLDDLDNDGSLTPEEKDKLMEGFENELSGFESDEELEELVEFLFELKDDPVAVFKDMDKDDDAAPFKMPPLTSFGLKKIEFKPLQIFRRAMAARKASKRNWDDLLDMDFDDVKAMAAEISDLTGEKVDPADVAGFLGEHGEEAEEAFYVVASELKPEDFKNFEELLKHPGLLEGFLGELDNRGLFDDDKESGESGGKSEGGKWDDLLDLDLDDVKAMASEISKLAGEKVDPQDLATFLDQHGEEAEESFYVVASELKPEDFKNFEELLKHPSLLADFLGEMDNRGMFDEDDKKKRMFGKKKVSKKSWDDLLDMDVDDVKDMAAEISDLIGEKVDPEDVGEFLGEHGKEAEEAFYVVASELKPEDFNNFQELLKHPGLLESFLGELDNRGLFDDDKKKRMFGKKKVSKKSWDDLLDMDFDDVKAMAAEVSKLAGEKVDPQDLATFLDQNGEEAEEAFYVVASELKPEDFKNFEELLKHPGLLADFLGEMDNRGMFDDMKKK